MAAANCANSAKTRARGTTLEQLNESQSLQYWAVRFEVHPLSKNRWSDLVDLFSRPGTRHWQVHEAANG